MGDVNNAVYRPGHCGHSTAECQTFCRAFRNSQPAHNSDHSDTQRAGHSGAPSKLTSEEFVLRTASVEKVQEIVVVFWRRMEETCTARDTKEPTAPTDTQRQRRWRVALQLLLIIMQRYIYILVKKVCTHYSFAEMSWSLSSCRSRRTATLAGLEGI